MIACAVKEVVICSTGMIQTKLERKTTYLIHVCDAIMGTGKTSATITYLNEHKDDLFIYITPYLDEANRIKEGCPDLGFVEPSDKIQKFGYQKSKHTAHLIKTRRNITTTHQAFKGYTKSMLEDIAANGYTLIIDENVDVLEKYEIDSGDLEMAVEAGYVKRENDTYSLTDKTYHGAVLREMFRFMQSRKLIQVDEHLFYWALPPDLIYAFKEVYVLTYLFAGQSLHHFFQIHNMPYEFVGIERGDDGSYRFGEYPGYTPEYVSHIHDKIHVVDNDKMNEVGRDQFAMSINWFDKREDEVEKLRKNMYNFFNNICDGVPVKKKLFGTIGKSYTKVRGKGYANRGLAFNTKATNDYRECNSIVYPVNIFMDVAAKNFYISHGIEIDEDEYALSIMVQFIWRSAIRDGEEILLYIPSARMRNILLQWMDRISRGGVMSG